MPWGRLLKELKAGKIDLIPEASFTESRAKIYQYSIAYREIKVVFYSLKKIMKKQQENSLISYLDSGLKVGYLRQGYYGPNFENLKKMRVTAIY